MGIRWHFKILPFVYIWVVKWHHFPLAYQRKSKMFRFAGHPNTIYGIYIRRKGKPSCEWGTAAQIAMITIIIFSNRQCVAICKRFRIGFIQASGNVRRVCLSCKRCWGSTSAKAAIEYKSSETKNAGTWKRSHNANMCAFNLHRMDCSVGTCSSYLCFSFHSRCISSNRLGFYSLLGPSIGSSGTGALTQRAHSQLIL